MADSPNSVRWGAQDTGNPVLDSLVNIICCTGDANRTNLGDLHEVLLELAVKEPGGLKVPLAGAYDVIKEPAES